MKWNIPRHLVANRLPRDGGSRQHAGRGDAWSSSPTEFSSPTAPATPPPWGVPSQTLQTLIRTAAESRGTPIFGICLGHQLLGQALGGSTYKLKFGHRGANHPVRNEATGKIEITTQNHGFAVDPSRLPDDVELTHVNLNDGTLEGLRHKTLPVMAVQYHPEASAGPHDSQYLFAEFRRLMG